MKAIRNQRIHSVCRQISWVAAASVLSVSLAGCGGGNNTDIVVSKPGTALYTTASPSLTIPVGATQTFQIGGGGSGSTFTSYSATSSNTNVLSVSVSGTTLSLAGLQSGSSTVTVTDSAGNTVVVKVTVGNNAALSIQAPATVTVAPNSSNTYSLVGGNPPYTVVSSNLAVINPTISGNNLVLNSLAAGGAQIVVYDGSGASANLAASVSSAGSSAKLYTTAPTSISLSIGGVIPNYQIGGGTPPYVVSSNTPDIISVNQPNTNSFVVRGTAVGFGTLSITDSVGASTFVSVSVVSGKVSVPFYTTAPASLTIVQGTSGSYSIAGGTPPYTAVSSNQIVATTNVADSNLTISGVSTGSANIVVRDSVGAISTVALTVGQSSGSIPNAALYTTSPSSVNLQTSTSSTFNVGGGTGPYTVSSSNSGVASASISNGVLSIVSSSVGTAKIVVTDSVGAQVTITVNVSNPNTSVQSLFSTAPSAIVVSSGASYLYSVEGGTFPYVAVSSNTAVATASIVGSSLTISGVSSGSANVVVTDAIGSAITIAVTGK